MFSKNQTLYFQTKQLVIGILLNPTRGMGGHKPIGLCTVGVFGQVDLCLVMGMVTLMHHASFGKIPTIDIYRRNDAFIIEDHGALILHN
jgi:hypothetical protein